MIQHADDATRARNMIRSRRDLADYVLSLAEYLADRDRLLLEQVYRHGLAVTEVAHLTGDRPRTLQRRVQRLLKHLNDPLFRYVAARQETLPRDRRAVARLVMLEGLSLREAARRTGLTLHRVRRYTDDVRAMARMA